MTNQSIEIASRGLYIFVNIPEYRCVEKSWAVVLISWCFSGLVSHPDHRNLIAGHSHNRNNDIEFILHDATTVIFVGKRTGKSDILLRDAFTLHTSKFHYIYV